MQGLGVVFWQQACKHSVVVLEIVKRQAELRKHLQTVLQHFKPNIRINELFGFKVLSGTGLKQNLVLIFNKCFRPQPGDIQSLKIRLQAHISSIIVENVRLVILVHDGLPLPELLFIPLPLINIVLEVIVAQQLLVHFIDVNDHFLFNLHD